MNHALGVGWRKWLQFAEILGNIQLFILFSLVYWSLVPLVAIPFKLYADPLAFKRIHSVFWVSCRPVPDSLESMRRQDRAE